uniref:Probable serine hydroxymethyltransferase n=1 Tax=candidate division CPR3 bacterium TaxID=2268181 RepID=A0A7C5YXR3_UNCC3
MDKIFELIKKEEERQRKQLEMIPSENYVSRNVLRAVGSVLMNKYSEGQVRKRYYQGNLYIDKIEEIVKKKALKAFGLSDKDWSVNVQPVTGSIANLAVLTALLKQGEKILAMSLYDGGHLSHGWRLPNGKPVSLSSKIFKTSYYYVDPKSGVLNYEEIEKIAIKEKPKIIISGGTAYPREIDHKKMGEICKKVGAYYFADIAHEAGLIVAGVNQSPFPFAHVVTTTTRKTLRGPVGAIIFSRRKLAPLIDQAVFPGIQGGPQNHSIAGIGIALKEAMTPQFKEYAKQVVKNAKILADEMIKYGYDVKSGGTDKHLIVIDLRNKAINGKEAAIALEKANIIVNKNTVPGESGTPWEPSGIRMGTPAITSRGIKGNDIKKIAYWIHTVLSNIKDEKLIRKIANDVSTFASKFPLPGVDM